jgi:hypothetical protein
MENRMNSRTFAAVLACAAVFPFAGIAQVSFEAPSSKKPPVTSGETAQKMTEVLQKKLAEQGFSEVEIVPGSFIVTAKDKDGQPVAMVIGPHSTMVFTQDDQDEARVPEPQPDKSKWY